MHRILFHVGSLNIYSYGVFLAFAFIAATMVARRRFQEQYKNPDVVLDLVLAAVVGGILGARLFYVVGHWSYYMAHTGEIFKVNMDGLVFYGGLVLGLALALIVGHIKHLRFWTTMDLAGLTLPLALATGRIGCLLNGCCYGKPTSFPWGITYPASSGLIGARQPTQIYELILDLTLFGLLWWKRDSFERDGTILWLFALGYGIIRFTMEFFREHAAANAAFTFQLMSLALIVSAGIVLLFRYRILPASSTESELS